MYTEYLRNVKDLDLLLSLKCSSIFIFRGGKSFHVINVMTMSSKICISLFKNYNLWSKNKNGLKQTGQNILLQGYWLKGNRPGTMYSIIYQPI